jgi:hypothetical protein
VRQGGFVRIPRPATLVLAVVSLTLTGLIVARVSAQVEDSPTDHPPIVVPSSSVAPSPTPSPRTGDDDDDDDGFEKVQPRPRDIGDDDDDDDDRGERGDD